MKLNRINPFVWGISLMCAVLLPPAVTTAQSPMPGSAPKLIGVAFYADWCPDCKELGPEMMNVMKDVSGLPIYFTRFDLTNEQTKAQSALFAEWVGLGTIYRQNSGSTGYGLLIDPQRKQVVGKLMHTQTEAELKSAIQSAVSKTSPVRTDSAVRQSLNPAP